MDVYEHMVILFLQLSSGDELNAIFPVINQENDLL